MPLAGDRVGATEAVVPVTALEKVFPVQLGVAVSPLFSLFQKPLEPLTQFGLSHYSPG